MDPARRYRIYTCVRRCYQFREELFRGEAAAAMGLLESHMPTIATVALQFAYAGMALLTEAALTQGMSPTVFVFYRQAIAAIFMAPIAYFAKRREPNAAVMGKKNLSLIFITSLIGISTNQNCYFMGMYYTSSSIATAMTNLLPPITFVLAAALGLEKVNLRSIRSFAKIIGTIASVFGAVAIALIKGRKLLNSRSLTLNSILQSTGENWVLGCSLLFVRSCCWSLWLILQVPMSEGYPDHLSLSTWMCFFAAIQTAIIAIIFEPNLEAWKFDSSIMILCCIYSGTIGSGVAYFVQSWCISKKGPVFNAMFSPLCTVIVTITACILLHEQLYMGSLIGSIIVVAGLYAVLWGQAHDLATEREVRAINVTIKDSSDESSKDLKIEIREPLLGDKLYYADQNETTH